MSLRIAIVYTVEANHPHGIANPHGAEQLGKTNDALKRAIEALGHYPYLIPGDFNLLNKLFELRPDVIFNNCTGINDKSSQPQIAGLLELSKIPFTGSGQTAHTLALYKPLAKKVLSFHGVPTPAFVVIDKFDDDLPIGLSYPVIVKPEREGSSIGISAKSVALSPREARTISEQVIQQFRQPALVEEFVAGREFTVGVLEAPIARILPPVEIMFTGSGDFYTQQVKSRDAVETKCPADIHPALLQRIGDVVLDAFNALGCRDYARIDVRVDASGVPYVIDVNTLPGIEPGYSDYPKAALAGGLSYEQLINHLLQNALQRSLRI
ncbi:MAG: D-alanine--D-alanine ligase B [Firmicutes bacterium]|nr:D-alanine--D-alanine ligase B [candidate division NPL-UPA2 bacterium]MBT9155068.1 D-alanine--D-alanine ligase B [candidate division NPL-UPA2 bacterium]